jgi:hypothetical protein
MADEQLPENPANDSEYEEIAYEEVDRVCAALEELRDTVESQNVQAYLDDAINNIFSLVYEECADEEDQSILPFSDAA